MHRGVTTQPPKHQRGFTIVELLIVIVVIAILAAITIVAYNGVTSRANDSARQADANALMKKIEMRFAESGEYGYGYGAETPESRDSMLEMYDIRSLGSRILVCHYDLCPEYEGTEVYDRSRIYLQSHEWYVDLGYWNGADAHWENRRYSTSPTPGFSDWEGDTPVGLASNVSITPSGVTVALVSGTFTLSDGRDPLAQVYPQPVSLWTP